MYKPKARKGYSIVIWMYVATVLLASILVFIATRATAEPIVCAQQVIEVEKDWTTGDIEAEIRRQSSLYDIDADRMVRIAKCESGLNPNARNLHSTANGIFQIIDGTWEHYGCTGGISNPEDNIKCAMKIATTSGYSPWVCK